MELEGDHIRITRRGQIESMPLQSLASAPHIQKGILGAVLTIRSGEHDFVSLKGASYHAAHDFLNQVVAAWTRFNLAALENEAARLDKILASVLSLAVPTR